MTGTTVFTITRNLRVGGWTVTDNDFAGPFVAGEMNGARTFRTKREAQAFIEEEVSKR